MSTSGSVNYKGSETKDKSNIKSNSQQEYNLVNMALGGTVPMDEKSLNDSNGKSGSNSDSSQDYTVNSYESDFGDEDTNCKFGWIILLAIIIIILFIIFSLPVVDAWIACYIDPCYALAFKAFLLFIILLIVLWAFQKLCWDNYH